MYLEERIELSGNRKADCYGLSCRQRGTGSTWVN